ncbi:MAG: hypothetical protein N0C81_07995 [Candidatus Thiodiazotropha lotti]|uniref:Uncharacterized protein n=1 Tax=Candidatus Thiodiazotropha lotti TaxID=2792787 RepID=A0A9E4K6X3_9GAMM|nr:hypothetical protein [Candidatus Thiodiazotropha lotti]ODC01586.1 hypothetical protein A3197_03695 [Candidatus Thiodiazotropha endoloripes]MCG7922706.1 hypothetical protein [Candidatus Thiodiazotropha lotti]MCG7932673.1 hypothetical protein [Candidatus Thiodiazotropha lotti]MCG7939956.1 hypothetical protein [Candidatus Thiodiazotropha lotti]
MSKPIIILWSILSFIVSGIYVFYGLMMLQVEQLPTLQFIAATMAFGYGLITIYLLSLAWTKTDKSLVQMTKYIVVTMFVAQIVLTLDVGMISGFEWLGILIVSLMVGINWISIKSVTEYHNQV